MALTRKTFINILTSEGWPDRTANRVWNTKPDHLIPDNTHDTPEDADIIRRVARNPDVRADYGVGPCS